MSKSTITQKANQIRTETEAKMNTGSRVAAVLDDINESFIPMEGLNPGLGEKITGPLYQGNININEGLSGANDYKIYSGALSNGYYQSSEFRRDLTGQGIDGYQNMSEQTIGYGKTYSNNIASSNGSYTSINEQKVVFENDPSYSISTYSSSPSYKNGNFQMSNSGVGFSFQSGLVYTGVSCGVNGINFSGIPNLEGDITATKQIVQTTTGIIGWVNKTDSSSSGRPALKTNSYSEWRINAISNEMADVILIYSEFLSGNLILAYDPSKPTFILKIMSNTVTIEPEAGKYINMYMENGFNDQGVYSQVVPNGTYIVSMQTEGLIRPQIGLIKI